MLQDTVLELKRSGKQKALHRLGTEKNLLSTKIQTQNKIKSYFTLDEPKDDKTCKIILISSAMLHWLR